MSNLNKQQTEAIKYNDGPLLIVAGAGTGKTTVITEKIAYLVNQKLAKPEEILALTFTEKAAGEMEERVDKLLDLGYSDMQISTFHAFCQKLLEYHGLDIGLSNQFKLLTPTDAWLLVRKKLDKFNLDYYRPLGNPTRHIHELIRHFSKCKDELITPKEYLEYAEDAKLDGDEVNKDEKTRLAEIANAYHTYNQLLLDSNCLDFGDLIFYTIKLLHERPNILKLLQNKYKYILVDEFQDVNYAQYELVKLFSDGGSQLTVVGDDDQSIYAFRGASVSNILRFKDDFPKAKEIVLTENYRSGQEILDLAYKSIQNNNPDRLEVKLNINKKLASKNNEQRTTSKSEVTYKHFQTSTEEVDFVVSQIRDISADKLVDFSDFAILIRANSQAEPFINALEKAGLPYEYLASSGLYSQPIILDCVGFFKAINNYHESPAIYRLLCLPSLAFPADDLIKLTHFAKKKSISLHGALKQAVEIGIKKDGLKIIEQLISLITVGSQSAKSTKPTLILLEFLEKSGYFSYLTKEEEQGNRTVLKQIQHLRQFFDYLKNYEETNADAKVADFLEHYNYVLEAGDDGSLKSSDNNDDAIKILTIHSAKGLEFKYVFVVNLVDDRFPSRNRGEAIELPLALIKEQLPEGDYHLEEERRLFYVACTRAKEKLFLTSAEDYGGTRKKKVSRFIAELGFESVAKSEVRSLKSEVLAPKKDQKNKRSEDRNKIVMSDTFSYSQINSYLRCPYQYKLSYILKIPTKGNASFSFGSSIHNTLQKFYKQIIELNSSKQDSLFGATTDVLVKNGKVKAPTFIELIKLYEVSWIVDWYKDKKQREDYFTKGKELLKTFYDSQGGQPFGSAQSEWTVPVAIEGWFKIKIGNSFINGRIDRIDKTPEGTLEIIDYKTGKAKEKVIGDDKNQLLIYQLAAETLPEYRNVGAVSNLTFYYLEDNIKTSFIGNEKDKDSLTEKINATIQEIQVGDFTATHGEHICQHCDFKDICEFRRL